MERRVFLALPLAMPATAAALLPFTAPRAIVSDAKIHYGFPRIVRGANRDLLLFYRIGESHAYDHSSIAMRRSSDNGATWSAERILYVYADPDRSAHNPVAIVAKSGRVILWISGFRFRPLPQRREPGGWAWSDDHGATWSTFQTFDAATDRSSYYMTDVIRTADGMLGSNATFPASGVGNCWALMWHSSDDGRTWSVLSRLTLPEANRGDEVGLLETAPGQILCLLRTRRTSGSSAYPRGISVFRSRDGGRTWVEGENLYSQIGITLQRPFLTRIDERRVLLSGRDVERKEIVAFASRDNGRTFTDKTVIASYHKDGAYTSCVTVDGSEVLMVWYGDREGALPALWTSRVRLG